MACKLWIVFSLLSAAAAWVAVDVTPEFWPLVAVFGIPALYCGCHWADQSRKRRRRT